MVMQAQRDAYGAELLAAYKSPGHLGWEITERDDGFIAAAPWPPRYFSDYPAWTKRERQGIAMAKGRVLDIGCGAGRFSLYLQRKGFDVTAIDNSPGAVKLSKLRGVKKATLRPIAEIGRFKPGSFETVIMMGNNFGLFGSSKKAKHLLRELFRITTERGRIIAEATDPYQTRELEHRRYQQFNRRRGRLSGHLRIRVRHGKIIGSWFDYLLVSRAEMKEIVAGTGWRIRKILSAKGPGYTAIMEKQLSSQRAS